MKYVQPYGISDPDAHYINGNPAEARQGSIPPAAAFEHPMRELVAVIENSLVTPDDSDLEQVAKSIRSQRMNYAEDTGSKNLLSVAFDPPLTTYTIGLPIRVKIKVTNDGPATIDAGAARVSIKKPNGGEMGAGDLPANGLADLVFDGTNFQLINFGGAGTGGGTNIINVQIPYCVDTANPTQQAANQIIAVFAGGIPATLVPGTVVMVKMIHTNTSSNTTININGIGFKSVWAQGATVAYPLLPGDLKIGDVLIFAYDGAQFWIYPSPSIDQNTTFNVGTVTQFNDLFTALGRKRILPSARVIVQMATGIYIGPLTTYHVDSVGITIQGTLLQGTSVPSMGQMARSGSSGAARAQDSATNINTLRSYYGTEIRGDNTMHGIVGHAGTGPIQWKNVLITGSNVQAGSPMFSQMAGIGVSLGYEMHLLNVAVWGVGGGEAVSCNGGTMELYNVLAVGNLGNGITCAAGAGMGIIGGGATGNAGMGIRASYGATITAGAYDIWPGVASVCNALNGLESDTGSTIMIGGGGGVSSNAGTDVYALIQSNIRSDGSVPIGTMSPAPYTVGNYNSIIYA